MSSSLDKILSEHWSDRNAVGSNGRAHRRAKAKLKSLFLDTAKELTGDDDLIDSRELVKEIKKL